MPAQAQVTRLADANSPSELAAVVADASGLGEPGRLRQLVVAVQLGCKVELNRQQGALLTPTLAAPLPLPTTRALERGAAGGH